MNNTLNINQPYRPLADRMRPTSLEHYFGQSHLLSCNAPLRLVIEQGNGHSMLFWGPSGVGKTTLAKIIAKHYNAEFIELSAVLGGMKDIRAAIDRAKDLRKTFAKQTLLFVDEVHRFNKSQQDAFLPYIENGMIIFMGATTEHPNFVLNNALLSRLRIYRLKSLDTDDIYQIISHALKYDSIFIEHGLSIETDALNYLARVSNGDARKGLNGLEMAYDLVASHENKHIDLLVVEAAMQTSTKRFDKQGDIFYEQISALHKSVRGSQPDAALFWFATMVESGCDPLDIARRITCIASEDIGNADPRGLEIALNAWQSYERLGAPEGELAIAQAIIYLACAPKSNAVYTAYKEVKKLLQSSVSQAEVPLHLRNASTELMRQMEYGKNYRYPHDEDNAYASGEHYFPNDMNSQQFYYPVNRGLEKKISAKLAWLRTLDKNN